MIVELMSRRLLLDDTIPVEEGVFQVRQKDGRSSGPIRRLNVKRGEGAAALVRHAGLDAFLFVRQFRYPTWDAGGGENSDGWLTEIPAGLCDPGETPEQTIARELEEEIGYRPRRLQFIARCYVTPGGSNERVHLFYAEVDETSRVGAGGGMDGEHEMIEVVVRSRADLFADLEDGRIDDAKTLIAVQWLALQQR